VTPSTAYLSRHREIRIDGYAVDWTPATRVDLGPDVVLSNLSAPLPSVLVADFGVAATAALGPRDVLVVDGDAGALVASKALSIVPPATLTLRGGAVAQGSIALMHLHVDDPSVPLDTTVTKDPFGNVTYTNLAPSLAAGLSAVVTKATELDADLELFVDVSATGTSDFDLGSGGADAGAVERFPIPGALDVAARTPLALTAGAPITGTVASPYATTLAIYAPTSSTPTIVDFQATSTGAGADPAVLLLPTSGAWSGQLLGGATATWPGRSARRSTPCTSTTAGRRDSSPSPSPRRPPRRRPQPAPPTRRMPEPSLRARSPSCSPGACSRRPRRKTGYA
jgi:hypothetical protein